MTLSAQYLQNAQGGVQVDLIDSLPIIKYRVDRRQSFDVTFTAPNHFGVCHSKALLLLPVTDVPLVPGCSRPVGEADLRCLLEFIDDLA